MAWIRRYIVFHRKTHPAQMGAADIAQFLTWLAVERRVSASTQNQALSALLFLYKDVLTLEIGVVPPIVRARTPERLPVVLSTAFHNYGGIRPAIHPVWPRCSSFKYAGYSQSSRLASRAPRRPRCVTVIMKRST